MDYRIDKIIDYIKNNNTIFEYEAMDRRILAVQGNIIYSSKTGVIYYSNNYGISWVEIVCPVFNTMHITSNNIVYGFTSTPTKLYKSTDFINFTEIDLSSFGDIDSVNWYNCDSNGNTFIFAEKNKLQQNTISGNSFARVFRTDDGGNTWDITLQQDLGHGVEDKIGHWHSVDYLGGAGIYNVPDIWIITSGDHNINIRWWISKDNGDTWTEIQGVQDQKYRTLVINRHADKILTWSTDAVPATLGGIYRCTDIDNVSATTELIQPIPLTSYGCKVRGKGICITEREGKYAVDGTVYLYATDDCGKTWHLDKEVQLKDNVNIAQPGFHSIIGPDGQGSYYIYGSGLKNVTSVKVKNKKQNLL